MASENQSYSSHAKWFPLYHFFVYPVLLAYAIWQIVNAVRSPTRFGLIAAVVAVAMAATAAGARVMAMRVQDRVIRLEETLRMQRLLPPSQLAEIGRLTRGQFVALRFAGDSELSELVRQTLAGELTTQKEIKQAVKIWRPDYHRA